MNSDLSMQDTVSRINELSRLSKERPLTEAEKQEQQALRRKYLDSIKENLKNQLDHTSVVYPDGTVKKLHKK